ncbi:outer membrane efflux protein [Pseudoxanthomonas spadix BD-a59]|uniref:Outer membrane efflux protein n=1 Tax=Pseudoxanthomonas spadix (strain BD-a59) TaxID=1045855 RepID=G7UT27_PSEUP|nr:TolC family protein [Pseudoxanthomonas spadix]AER56092.1 outer membrane efflux protein [Pseudoxanthomonas spadix BD-a59]
MSPLQRLLVAVLASLPAAALAQDYLPPEHLVGIALEAQPNVRAAMARAGAATANARALSVGSHEFEASVIPQYRTTDADGDFREWEALLSRRIRLPGKARLDRQIGDHTRSAADLRLDDAEHQAARRLLELWMGWLGSSVSAEETSAQQALLVRERDALARRVALGDAAQRDLELFEAERAQLAVQAIGARAAAIAARQALAAEFPQIPLPERAPALPEPVALPGDVQAWRELIIARSHEIGIAREDATRQSLVAARARADRRPDPSVGVRVMSDRSNDERAIGLVLSVPIGSAYRSAQAAAESANATAAEADADAVRLMIEQAAWATAQAAQDRMVQWQLQQQSLAAQTAASTRTRRAWELGEIPLSEYLLAQRNQRQAQLAEALARVQALQAILLVRVDTHELWHPELASAQPHAGGEPSP